MYFPPKAHRNLSVLRNTRQHFTMMLRAISNREATNTKHKNVKNMAKDTMKKSHLFAVRELKQHRRASLRWASAGNIWVLVDSSGSWCYKNYKRAGEFASIEFTHNGDQLCSTVYPLDVNFC